MKTLLLAVVFLCAGGAAIARSSKTNSAAAASHATTQESPAAKTFASNCAVCHGSNGTSHTPVGQGMHAADLTSARIQTQSDATLIHFIREGQGSMPAFRDVLTQRQIEEQVKYLRVLGKGNTGR